MKLIFFCILLCAQVVGASTSRTKTVGDILKNIDSKGASRSSSKKTSAAIPKTRRIQVVKPKNLSKIKPTRTKSLRQEGEQAAQLESVIDESIDELYKLTQKYKKSANRGELWIRLGELYVEKAKLMEISSYEDYDRKLNLYFEKKIKRKPVLNLKLSRDFNKKAIRLYDWFVRDFPKDRKVDQALFFLGYNYFKIGNLKKGAKYYEVLNKRFPRSKFVSESNFALGEYYFDSNQWKKSAMAYDMVIKRGDPRLISFAYFKKAWALHKLGKTKVGITYLEKVIELSKRSKRKIKLVSEAQRDLVLFYANIGRYSDAKNYLSRYIDRDDLNDALEKLGFLYVEYGNRGGVRYIFSDLIDSNPTQKKAMDFQFQIANIYAAGGKNKTYIQELNKLIKNYGPESSWAKANPDKVEASEDLREKFLRNHSLQNHQLYLKSRSKIAKSMAKEGYKLYLAHFQNGKNVSEINFFYAELLFDEKKYKEAARSYDRVVQANDNSKYYVKALNNSLISLEKGLPSEKSIRKKVGDSVDKFALPDSVKLFISMSLGYLDKFKKPLRRAEIKFRVGRLYYLYNHFDMAEASFKDVIQKYPRTKYADFSTNLILDIYNLKKDYKGLTAVGEELLANPNLKSSAAIKDVKNVLEKSAFKKAQTLEESKDYLASAKEFQGFAEKYPKSELVVGATYNAGVNYERAGKVILALSMYAIVGKSKSTKNKKEQINSLLLQANLFQKIGRYKEAAQSFESYARQNPNYNKIADVYYNTATLWDAMNNDHRAVSNYEAYYKKSKKSDKAEVLYKIARVYENKRKYSSAIQFLKRFIKEYDGDPSFLAEAHNRMANIYEIMGDTPKSLYWHRQIYNKYKRNSGKTVRYVAEAKLKMTLEDYKSYEKLRFPKDPNAQAKILNKKLKLLDDLSKKFTEIIKYNSGPQILASLTWLGKSYEHFSDAVENAPKPKGLTADELKQYNAGILQVTDPKRKLAIDFYKQALKKSSSLEIFDQSTQIAYDALSRYEPKEYHWGQDYIIESPSVQVGKL